MRATNLLPTLTLPNLQLTSKGRPKKVANAEDVERAKSFLEDIRAGINEADAQVKQVLQGGTGNNPGGLGTRRMHTLSYRSSHVTLHTHACTLTPHLLPSRRKTCSSCRIAGRGDLPHRRNRCPYQDTKVARTHPHAFAHRLSAYIPTRLLESTTHYVLLTNHAMPYYATPVPTRTPRTSTCVCFY